MRSRKDGVGQLRLCGWPRRNGSMRRWNGWGDDIGRRCICPMRPWRFSGSGSGGTAPNDATLGDVVAEIPPSRLPHHPLVTREPEARLRASVGQSLEDWLRLRFGRIQAVVDGVAFPETEEEVAEALALRDDDGRGRHSGRRRDQRRRPSDAPPRRAAVARDRPDPAQRRLLSSIRSLLATFEAGVAGPDLEAQLRAHGFVLGHYPQSFEYSTLGGWIATRSCGQQSARYGRIEALFAGGRIETPIGPLDLPAFPASAAGPGPEGMGARVGRADRDRHPRHGPRVAGARSAKPSWAISFPTGTRVGRRRARSRRRGSACRWRGSPTPPRRRRRCGSRAAARGERRSNAILPGGAAAKARSCCSSATPAAAPTSTPSARGPRPRSAGAAPSRPAR